MRRPAGGLDEVAAVEEAVRERRAERVAGGGRVDGVDALPEGIDGIDALPKITLELVRRGYEDDAILKILGGNFLRVFEAAEAYAASTKTTLSGDGSTKKIEP